MRWANITSLYKGKGDKLDLNNDRGIFLVTVFRSILMKLIYNDKYDIIDQNMSDSNVGARKRKNIRNHIFIINGIINDVLNSKGKAIDIQILDYKQCFDAMWLEETLNDMYEAGIKDDNLAILYEANKTVEVAVKTPHGLTKREAFKKIILQGDVFGPLECSVSVDTYGKEALAEDIHIYTYKGGVRVPPLAMVDDLLIVTECGFKSTMANSYINTKSAMKKLQFGTQKCHKMHVGKHKVEEICPDLFVEGWKMTEVEEIDTGKVEIEEEYDGLCKMEEVSEDKYLGDILSEDGKNSKNIVARKNRGTGSVNQILSILDEICFGKYFFEVARILRMSLLISSLLSNSESWYNLTEEDLKQLEQVDEKLLRGVLECPVSTPKEMLYLELNCIPVRYIIMSRRLNFLHYILNEDENSLIFTFFMAQLEQPSRQDWCQTVIEDLKTLKINLTLNELRNLEKSKFKKLIKDKIEEEALKYLNSIKAKHSKVLHIKHSKMMVQDYLRPEDTISINEAKFLFLLRTRMLDVRANFEGKYKDLMCPACKLVEDTQPHLIECSKLSDDDLVEKLPEYNDLFGDDLEPKVNTSRIIRMKFQRRKEFDKKTSQTNLAQVIQT